jgi:putative endonuclease
MPSRPKQRRRTSATQAGQAGEEAAARYLQQQGWVILARNCRLPGGEIDIVAQDGGCLVFVEVKTRRGSRFGSPFEAVDNRKQQRLTTAALAYMSRRNLNMAARFDVAAVFPEQDSFRVELLRNAFDCGEL